MKSFPTTPELQTALFRIGQYGSAKFLLFRFTQDTK